MELPNWSLLEWLGALGALVAILTAVVGAIWAVSKAIGGVVRRRRAAQQRERDAVRSLLEWLWGHRVLYEHLYNENPVGALQSVREIRARLRDDLGRLPEKSIAIRPVREMHEACTEFLRRIEPLPMPKESESLPDEWLGGVYWQTLGDALYRLRRVFDPCMDRLYEGYAIQKPPPRERQLYVEPLFDVGKLVERDNVEKGLRLLRGFNELAEDKPTNLVLRTDAAVKARLTTDEFDTVVRLLIEEGYIVRTKAARSEAYRLTPEGVRKGERYKLLAQGLNPDTGEPLQGQ